MDITVSSFYKVNIRVLAIVYSKEMLFRLSKDFTYFEWRESEIFCLVLFLVRTKKLKLWGMNVSVEWWIHLP
jgi:hypothetical protein